jgi:Fe-S-cluster formation regulator IscX/YfhJ
MHQPYLLCKRHRRVVAHVREFDYDPNATVEKLLESQ